MAIVVKRRELTFWEKTYLPEVFRGLRLTARHFFINMARHVLRFFGGRPVVPGAVTFQYPEVRRPVASRYRTMHRLMKRDDGTPRCVACMLCETACPALCIHIVAEDHPDPRIEKRPQSFDIDLGKCVMCGLCVEACPEDAIRMDTGILEFAEYTRGDSVLDMETLLGLEPVPWHGTGVTTTPSSSPSPAPPPPTSSTSKPASSPRQGA